MRIVMRKFFYPGARRSRRRANKRSYPGLEGGGSQRSENRVGSVRYERRGFFPKFYKPAQNKTHIRKEFFRKNWLLYRRFVPN